MDFMDMYETIEGGLNLPYNEPRQDKIVLLKKCLSKDTKRWHLCLKKEYFNQVRKHGEEFGNYKIVKYRPNNKPIGSGKTYAFYIPYASEESKNHIINYIKRLDGTFIHPGSYTFHFPLLRKDGSDRGYMLMSFKKNGEFYPQSFIRKLRTLLDGTRIYYDKQELINLKWCNLRVLRDLTANTTK